MEAVEGLLWVQPPHKADLSSPDLTILVQVVKDACAIGVAARYRDLSKYNLRELCNPDSGNAGKAKPEKESSGQEAVQGTGNQQGSDQKGQNEGTATDGDAPGTKEKDPEPQKAGP